MYFSSRKRDLIARGEELYAIYKARRHGAIPRDLNAERRDMYEISRITADLERLLPWAEAQRRFRGESM